MKIDGMELPARLVELIEARIWPRTGSDAGPQNLRPLVATARVRLLAADETRIYLYPSEGLCSIAREIASDDLRHEREKLPPECHLWKRFGDLNNTDPSQAMTIAVFGIGSDSPVVLDYRADPRNPAVLRLLHEASLPEDSPASGMRHRPRTRWVVCAPTFDDFVERLGLTPSTCASDP